MRWHVSRLPGPLVDRLLNTGKKKIVATAIGKNIFFSSLFDMLLLLAIMFMI